MRDNAERSPDVFCPIQIHVHDPTIRERRRRPKVYPPKNQHQRVCKDDPKWIDLDENLMDGDGYILIDDRNLGPLVSEIDSEELPYPNDVEYEDNDDDDDDNNDNDDNDENNDDDEDRDTGSHSRREWSIYKQLKKKLSKRCRSDFDFGATYPVANSHGSAYQDSSSHSKYTELYSEFRNVRNNLDVTHILDVTPYAIANSHGEHGDLATEIRSGYRKSDNSQVWNTRPADTNYEIANSHSNYRVFYDSQTQHQTMMPPWLSEPWSSENYRGSSCVAAENPKDDTDRKRDNEECEAGTNLSEEKNEQDSGTTCDIEQCLVQIEESLLNIEQNLLHVQDLDIPELRNLLYKSPSIERSLYEVQDLLYSDGIGPPTVIAKNKSISLDSDEEEEEEEEEMEEEEVWVGQNITSKDTNNENVDAGAPPFFVDSNEESSDTANVDEYNPTNSSDRYIDWINQSNVRMERAFTFHIDSEKAMNFVPNSLGKTLSRKIILDEVKENIRLCSSEPEDSRITIDYNLNSTCAEKKSFFRDKWHSRTNSLDENSIFQNSEFGDKQENSKFSLQNIFFESIESRHFAINAKARSEGTLQTNQNKQIDRRGSHEEKLLQAVEATAGDFRKKLESFALQRQSILVDSQKKMASMRNVSDNTAPRSKEKSPGKSKRTTTKATCKMQDRENSAGKNIDKRKRKKTSAKNQSTSENALIPSKLISLSLSLLLAALLQAVRCLTDLVEDAFRSVSYDRNGLLQ